MIARITQGMFSLALVGAAGYGLLPMLQTQQNVITMIGLVYLVVLAVGLEGLNKAIRG